MWAEVWAVQSWRWLLLRRATEPTPGLDVTNCSSSLCPESFQLHFWQDSAGPTAISLGRSSSRQQHSPAPHRIAPTPLQQEARFPVATSTGVRYFTLRSRVERTCSRSMCTLLKLLWFQDIHTSLWPVVTSACWNFRQRLLDVTSTMTLLAG